MKWKEICKKYKQNWVLLDDVCVDEDSMQIIEGRVLYFNSNKDKVYQKAFELKPKKFAVEYTGEVPKNLVFML